MFFSDPSKYWESKYREYNEELFKELFPDFNIEFDIKKGDNTMLVRITKD